MNNTSYYLNEVLSYLVNYCDWSQDKAQTYFHEIYKDVTKKSEVLEKFVNIGNLCYFGNALASGVYLLTPTKESSALNEVVYVLTR